MYCSAYATGFEARRPKSALRQASLRRDGDRHCLLDCAGNGPADVQRVRSELQSVVTKAEVLTAVEFSSRSRSLWLFGTGAGAALFAGALLAMVVGSVVVAQTLYASTKEHLYEFATLRAIGSSGTYLHTVVIAQALLSAVAGFAIAFLIGLFVVRVTSDSALPVLMTPALTVILFLLTIVMCVISALSSILKVTRMDPAMVFSR
jgi:putative ABC transport system permease protein